MELKETFERVKKASKQLALLSDDTKNLVLCAVADAIAVNKETLLEANHKDLLKMDRHNPLYDRLQLTEERLQGIAGDMRNVATLPTPLRPYHQGAHAAQRTSPEARVGALRSHRHRV